MLLSHPNYEKLIGGKKFSLADWETFLDKEI
jgi:hypothetical protein